MIDKNVQIETEIVPLKRRLIDLLIEGRNISSAAKTVDVSRSTVYRWLKDPEFNSELRIQFAEEEDRRAKGRNDCLKKAWEVVNQAMAGDLPSEEKASLAAAQFVIRTLENSNASPRIESIIHQLDAFALAAEGPILDNQRAPPEKTEKMHESHASTRC